MFYTKGVALNHEEFVVYAKGLRAQEEPKPTKEGYLAYQKRRDGKKSSPEKYDPKPGGLRDTIEKYPGFEKYYMASIIGKGLARPSDDVVIAAYHASYTQAK